ncbi:hypothetical protein NMG60_11015271 [Bertholletia excelsa]
MPWKTSRGMPYLAAAPVAHGKNMSATRQLGRCSRRSCSRGSWSMVSAVTKLGMRSSEGICSGFSQPSGRPASTAGNRMVRILISAPRNLAPLMALVNTGALPGVVIMVDLMPRAAKSLAMSSVGIM